MSRTNYFSLAMPDEWREALAALAEHISSVAASIGTNSTASPTTTTTRHSAASPSSPSSLSAFSPMAQDDVHLTLCFVGEYLHHLKREQLMQLHIDLQAALAAASQAPYPLVIPSDDGMALTLFPPSKLNLFALMYDIPQRVVNQQEVLVDVVATTVERCLGKRSGDDIRARNPKGKFIAHSTLGKISLPSTTTVTPTTATPTTSASAATMASPSEELGGGGGKGKGKVGFVSALDVAAHEALRSQPWPRTRTAAAAGTTTTNQVPHGILPPPPPPLEFSGAVELCGAPLRQGYGLDWSEVVV